MTPDPVAASQTAGSESTATASAPQNPAGSAFHHGPHLASNWSQTPRSQQFEKHCKVCHDFDAPSPLGLTIPTMKCAACHVSDPTVAEGNQQRLVFSGGARRGPPSPLAFDHGSKTHRKRDCISCHNWSSPKRSDVAADDVRFAMPPLRTCAECHDHGARDPLQVKAAEQRKADPRADVQSLQSEMNRGGGERWRSNWDTAKGCESCHTAGEPSLRGGKRRSSERGFSHATHLPKQGGACNECHGIGGANQATGMDVKVVGCNKCHFGDAGAATTELVDDLQVARMPTQFTHATKGHREDCSGCHPTSTDSREPVVQRMYTDCTKSCHQERAVERHGLWRCSDCHRSGDPQAADEAAAYAIRTEKVQRPTGGSRFSFADMSHPGITTKGAAMHAGIDGQACSDCHRRPMPDLAHAAQAQPFDHDAHLASAAAATDRACSACHLAVRDAATSGAVLAFQEQSARERRTCTQQCHQSPDFAVAAVPTEVEVPHFSHFKHSATACVECHVKGDEVVALRDAGLRNAGAAFSCARCHGHKDEKKIAITGSYSRTEPGESCGSCHVPKGNPDYAPVARSVKRLQLVADVPQFHDKGGKCASCHELARPDRTPTRTPIRVASHLDPHQAHPGKNVRAVTSEQIRDPKNCTTCHATNPRSR